MGALEEALAQLLIPGTSAQAAIAAEDPYSAFQAVPDSLSKEVIGAKGYGTKDRLIAGLLTGLVSGIAGGASEDYRTRANKAYADVISNPTMDRPDVLSPSIFTQAQNQRSLFDKTRLAEALTAHESALAKEGWFRGPTGELVKDPRLDSVAQQKELEDLKTRNEIIKDLIKSPRTADRKLGLSMLAGGAAPTSPTESLASPAAPSSQAEKTQNRLEELVLEYGDYDLAGKALVEELKAAKSTKINDEKALLDFQKETETSGQVLTELRNALDLVGETGGFPGEESVRQLNLLAQSKLGSEEADLRLGARAQLQNLGISLTGQIRKLFPGSVSDFEFKKYLEAVPHVGQTPAQNEALYTKMANAYALAARKAEFLSEAKAQGIPLTEAHNIFDKQFPVGEVLRRTEFLPEAQKIQAQAQGRTREYQNSLPAEFVKGVSESPEVLTSLLKPKTYKEAFATPERAATTIGTGASALAGGITGAELGATIGSVGGPIGIGVGGLLGGALGAGAGLLGFNSAVEAGSEAVGVGTEKTVIPSSQDVREAARFAGQSFGIGALGKAAGAVKSGIKKAPIATEAEAAKIVETAKQDIAGVRPQDINAALKEGKIKYFDEVGNEVPVADATQYKTGLKQSIEVIDKDGFFKEITNNPVANKLAFDKRLDVAGKARSSLIEEANVALKEAHSKLSPTKQKQFPLEKNPKTGKGGFNPDFSEAIDTINKIGKTDPQLVGSLKARLKTTLAEWEKSSKSFESLQQFKENFGEATKWKAPSTEVAEAWNSVKKDIYSAFAKEQMRAFDYAMEVSDPTKIGALKRANLLYHSYKNLEPMINKRSSSPQAKLKFGIFATPESIIDRYPATLLSTAEKALAKTKGKSSSVFSLSPRASAIFGAVNQPRILGPTFKSQEEKDLINYLIENSSNQKKNLVAEEGNTSGFLNMSYSPKKETKTMQAPKHLVEAVIAQESGGNPKAINKSSGAIGLMQIMPRTGAEIAKKLGIEKYDLKDPETNRKFGEFYLSELLKMFNGDEELALAAYYSGPYRVRKLLTKYNGKTFADIKEHLGPVGQVYPKQVLARIPSTTLTA